MTATMPFTPFFPSTFLKPSSRAQKPSTAGDRKSCLVSKSSNRNRWTTSQTMMRVAMPAETPMMNSVGRRPTQEIFVLLEALDIWGIGAGDEDEASFEFWLSTDMPLVFMVEGVEGDNRTDSLQKSPYI